MRGSVVAGSGVVLLALGACGGESKSIQDDGNSTGGSNATGGSNGTGAGGAAGVPGDWNAACEQAKELICGMLERCAPLFAGLFLAPDCRAFYGDVCRDIATLPDTTLTPADFIRCYDDFSALSCNDWVYNGAVPSSCDFAGLRGIGSPCGNDVQCASRGCTASFDQCGTCTVLAGLGEDCFETDCEDGLECGADLLCAAPKHLGDPCSNVSPCPSVMVCEAGVCTRPPGAGAPCGMGALGCDIFQGALCNATTGLCEAIDVAREGEPCETYCEAGTFCDPSTTPATCVATLHEGQACMPEGPPCDTLLACDNGVCARLDPAICN